MPDIFKEYVESLQQLDSDVSTTILCHDLQEK